ncbi:MAG: c-type cytochrome [Caldilineaceae bacterium]|nr:c-type cytochrome [Caldilineaceae bacterium]
MMNRSEAAVHTDAAGHTQESGQMPAGEHTAATHGIPEEAAGVPNPVAVSDASVAAGKATYTLYCAVCHGEQGEGDGSAAAGLDPKPADFHAPHVQELPDGALFHVITHGREGTAMVAWESIIGEEERWDLVNFLRTFEAADH